MAPQLLCIHTVAKVVTNMDLQHESNQDVSYLAGGEDVAGDSAWIYHKLVPSLLMSKCS